MTHKLLFFSLLLLLPPLGSCQKIQVDNTVYEINPTYRYPLHQVLIKPKDRNITNFGCPKEKPHPLF